MSTNSGTRAVLAALFANAGIAIAKFVGFAITQSSAMLAEGIHSVADTANQVLLLFGGRQAKKPPTDDHPFGYGRERYFWSFVVALVLFSMGAVFAVFEGIEKLRHPHQMENVGWAIGILSMGLILESFSMRTAVQEARLVRGDKSWSQFVLRSKQPELPVVLLEDAGALLGLAIALGAILTAHLTGEPAWDGIGTVAIGLLLGAIAIVLAREMHSLLIGEAASADDRNLIVKAIETSPGVKQLANLRTQHLGPNEILVGAKVVFVPNLDTTEIVTAIDEIERRIQAAVPLANPIFIKPKPSLES